MNNGPQDKEPTTKQVREFWEGFLKKNGSLREHEAQLKKCGQYFRRILMRPKSTIGREQI